MELRGPDWLMFQLSLVCLGHVLILDWPTLGHILIPDRPILANTPFPEWIPMAMWIWHNDKNKKMHSTWDILVSLSKYMNWIELGVDQFY